MTAPARRKGRPPRPPSPAPPCAICGRLDGPKDVNGRPIRKRGERWGLGMICRTCHERSMRRSGPTPPAPRQEVVPECARCGTLGGQVHPHARNPTRHPAEGFGFPGGAKLCGDCKSDLLAERKAAARAIGVRADLPVGGAPEEEEIKVSARAIWRAKWEDAERMEAERLARERSGRAGKAGESARESAGRELANWRKTFRAAPGREWWITGRGGRSTNHLPSRTA